MKFKKYILNLRFKGWLGATSLWRLGSACSEGTLWLGWFRRVRWTIWGLKILWTLFICSFRVGYREWNWLCLCAHLSRLVIHLLFFHAHAHAWSPQPLILNPADWEIKFQAWSNLIKSNQINFQAWSNLIKSNQINSIRHDREKQRGMRLLNTFYACLLPNAKV